MPRGRLHAILVALACAVAGASLACSSSGRRDQYYGTTTGSVYHPPEAGVALPDAARAVDAAAGGNGGTADASTDADSGQEAAGDGAADASELF